MSALVLPQHYTSQPTEVAEVDWEHPFLKNVLVIVDPVSGTERVTGKPLDPIFSAEKMVNSQSGIGFYTGNNAKWSFEGGQPSDPFGNREITMFALSTILSTPSQTYAGIVGLHFPSQTGLITTTSSSRLDYSWANRAYSGAVGTLIAGRTYAAYGRSNIVAANTVQGAGGELYRSASLFGAGTGSAGALGYPTLWYLGGDHRYATSRYLEQAVHLVIIVNRYMQESELLSLSENPWQIFKREPLVFQATSGGGAGSVIDLGSITFSVSSSSVAGQITSSLTTSGVGFSSESIRTSSAIHVGQLGYNFSCSDVEGSSISGIGSCSYTFSPRDIEAANPITGVIDIDFVGMDFNSYPYDSRSSFEMGNGTVSFSSEQLPTFTLESRISQAIFSLDAESVETPFVLSLQDFTLNDVMFLKLESLGYSGPLNDKLLKYFLANGATSTDVDDAEKQWLLTQTVYKESVEDMYRDYLEGLGYSGSITKLIKDYWVNL